MNRPKTAYEVYRDALAADVLEVLVDTGDALNVGEVARELRRRKGRLFPHDPILEVAELLVDAGKLCRAGGGRGVNIRWRASIDRPLRVESESGGAP